MKSVSLTDPKLIGASTPYDSKTYKGRQYVLIGEARIWIAPNTSIIHNGETVKLRHINLNGGKQKIKTNKKIKKMQF